MDEKNNMTACKVLRSSCEGGEQRKIVMGRERDSLVVRECTEGELTKAIFGDYRHDHSLRLARKQEEEVARLANVGAAAQALQAFFGGTGRVLLDLEDWLDANGVAFEYRSKTGGDVVFRPARG